MKSGQKISSKELSELKGGASSGSGRDVTNLNTSNSCRCYFINAPSITNSNSTDWCQCICLKAPEKITY
ncbi:MAG: hypothetical protein LBV02_06495 [Bacteroidales bacterium]|jgi:hypothetical protein|nr:hypothetical protein [Bacteroidales bacterium]